ncbi:LacI family DNA-binding transcriptional regulator [Neobacillus sp. PS3-40]|uniref:LacI family DNA-binding transcriptional regulator n=1 Tax=Neobacillus sp. PS3-40 TaxID=3070679 RepID=UPI0027DFA318|nr:LacI family DNA-binding transcriptional regulator [Neobacillus sp. PS3-40]WML46201.1 LacI family DNA-binding transcriptional regulator [Neobacillus sp. PS3-40]
MSTIKDVAAAANVSVATVSRVLNNNGYVNEDTRKRVVQAISKLNYIPNEVARSLFSKQSKTIALIVPDIKNPFFPEVARAIEDLMSSQEYTLILCNSDEKIEKEIMYLNAMKQKYVDGIIIVTSTLTPKHIEKSDIPIVALDRTISMDIPSVSVDNFEGGRQAVQYLKSIGCKKIAHIRGPHTIINADERFKGYIDEVKNESWFSDDLVVNGNHQVLETTKVTKELLMKHSDIDGIFAGNDYMAVGVLKAAEQLGIRIPEDLSVIGFDGIQLCQLTSPELTTMAQPIYELGYRAAELLLEMIEGKPISKLHYQFQVKLMNGQSTKVLGVTNDEK